MCEVQIPISDEIRVTEFRSSDRAQSFLLNDREVSEFLLVIPCPYSESDFDEYFELVGKVKQESGVATHFAVRNKAEKMIGGFAFKELIVGHRGEIGYWLGQPFWNHGIMTKVVSGMMAYAVEHWDLVRVSANVFPENHASEQVLKKVGFEFEGLLRKLHKKSDQFIDAKSYAYVR